MKSSWPSGDKRSPVWGTTSIIELSAEKPKRWMIMFEAMDRQISSASAAWLWRALRWRIDSSCLVLIFSCISSADIFDHRDMELFDGKAMHRESEQSEQCVK